MKNIVFFGVSLTAANIIDVIRDNGTIKDFDNIYFLQDDPSKLGTFAYGCEIIGKFSDILTLHKIKKLTHFSLGLGNAKFMLPREYVYKECIKLGLEPLNAIHKNSYISPDSQIGKGNVICSHATISTHSHIKSNCFIGPSVSILEGVNIGNNVMLTGNIFLGGKVQIGKNVYVGPGVTIGLGVKIGDNSIIGAGSLVLKNIEENSFVFGNPISSIKPNTKSIEANKW